MRRARVTHRWLGVAMSAAALALSGCSLLKSNVVTPQVYLLQPTPAAATSVGAQGGPGTATVIAAPESPLLLSVLMPTAAPGLEGERIMVTNADGRLDYYASASWADRLPEVLQRALIDALRAAGTFASVQADTAPFNSNFTLQIEVRRFAAEYNGVGAPTVHVTFDCTLGRRSDRGIVASFTADASVPAADNRLGAVVQAFDQATGMALQQVIERARVDSG